MFVPEQGSYRASSIQPRLLQLTVPGDQSNGAMKADNRPFHLQRLCALPELHYGNTSVNLWNLQMGQWLPSHKVKMLTFYGRHTDLVTQPPHTIWYMTHISVLHSAKKGVYFKDFVGHENRGIFSIQTSSVISVSHVLNISWLF